MQTKITLIALISLLTLILSPAPSSLAQSCPSAEAGTSRIELENGLLTIRDFQGQASTKFQASDKCIIGAPASVPQFSIPTYEEMKSLYVTQNKIEHTPHPSPHTFTNSNPSLAQNTAYLYTVEDNLTIDQNFRIPKGTTVVVFVDGDLTIKDDLNDEKDSGVIFVVQKEVRIDPAVTQVNAFIITHGGFCSSYASGSCLSSVGKLTINGSVISFSPDPLKQPQFKRTNGLNIEPSEEIIYQPKYLVLSKNIFAKTLQLWSELSGEEANQAFIQTPTPTPTPTPILANTGFENGLSSWSCSNNNCSASSSEFKSGAKSARLSNATLYQGNIPTTTSQRWCLQAWVKKSPANSIAGLIIRDPLNRNSFIDTGSNPVDTWQRVYFSFVPFFTNMEVALFSASGNTAWFDDISLTKGYCP